MVSLCESEWQRADRLPPFLDPGAKAAQLGLDMLLAAQAGRRLPASAGAE